MTDQQWSESFARSMAVFFSGRALPEQTRRGRRVMDSDFMLMLNAHHEPLTFKFANVPEEARWTLRLNTAVVPSFVSEPTLGPNDTFVVDARSIAVFEYPQPRPRPA